eukprot:6425536-Amphidinium_carterae.1
MLLLGLIELITNEIGALFVAPTCMQATSSAFSPPTSQTRPRFSAVDAQPTDFPKDVKDEPSDQMPSCMHSPMAKLARVACEDLAAAQGTRSQRSTPERGQTIRSQRKRPTTRLPGDLQAIRPDCHHRPSMLCRQVTSLITLPLA